MNGLLGDYSQFLKSFLDKGYVFKTFDSQITPKKNIILRHDVDFDVQHAEELSILEDKMGIKSIYFFLLRSSFYNILDKKNIESIKSIQDKGHQISIHFDNSLYEDVHYGIQQEKKLFKLLFGEEIYITSIHRPNESFINNEVIFKNILHTYEPKFFKDIKYFADSRGSFRFGHPLESKEFENNESLHLCIHPIWWVDYGLHDANDIMNKFLQKKYQSIDKDMYDNFSLFNKIK